MLAYLGDRLLRPEEMKPEAYQRNIAARAYDVARYCLPLGIPTGVGQVVSIRTLERQIRRFRASEYRELVELGDEAALACSEEPHCLWTQDGAEPVAPTLARYVDADAHPGVAKYDLHLWAEQNLAAPALQQAPDVDLIKPADTLSDIVATLLYTVTHRTYRDLYETVLSWSPARRMEVISTALRSRSNRDELLRSFRGGPYVYDMLIDIGAYRDLHRHRRCHQFRQDYSHSKTYAAPAALADAGLLADYSKLMDATFDVVANLPSKGREYLLPFAAKSRFLFKMDFAEAEYISRLRSGVKGHFSYREIAWQMKQRMQEVEPELGSLIHATPPSVEDPLKR
jgi:hypothetical protein